LPGGLFAGCGGSQGRLLAAQQRPLASLRASLVNPCRGRPELKTRQKILEPNHNQMETPSRMSVVWVKIICSKRLKIKTLCQ
jgi:hypothetical protein